jgi:hypothetical protein
LVDRRTTISSSPIPLAGLRKTTEDPTCENRMIRASGDHTGCEVKVGRP